MSTLSTLDEFYIEMLLDISQLVKSWLWKSDHFLVCKGLGITIDHSIVPEGMKEKLDHEIEELFGHEKGRYRYVSNPAACLMYNCYQIERRKEFVKELEKAKQTLEKKLEKPNSRRGRKKVKQRLKKLQRRIDINKIGTEHAFLTENEMGEFRKRNHVPFRVFEHSTIYPLFELDGKYEKTLDIMEKLGVPNVETHRGFGKRTKRAFFDNYLKYDFAPYAITYLLNYREEAVEDIARGLSAVTSGGDSGGKWSNIPDLAGLMADEKIQKKILELGLPQKEMTELFVNAYSYIGAFYDYKPRFIRAAKDFYRAQLEHDDISFRWAAAKTLAESYKLPEVGWRANLTKEQRKKRKEEQRKSYGTFKSKELDKIINALDLDRKYPLLTKNKSLVAERLLRYIPSKLEGEDFYQLKTLEGMIPLMGKATPLLKKHGINITLKDFIHLERLDRTAEALEWIVDNMDCEEYDEVADNTHFRRLLKIEFNLVRYLKEKPLDIIKCIGSIKNISIELEDYSEATSSRKFEEIYEFIFRQVGFNESALETYELYKGFLDKTFNQFTRDFVIVGGDLTDLPKIAEHYKKFFSEDKLKTLLNYVVKKKSRDIIRGMANSADDFLVYRVAEKLDEKTNKKDTVNILCELNKTYATIKEVGAFELVEEFGEKLAQMADNSSAEDMLSAILDSRRECYTRVIGEGVEVHEDLEEMVDNIVIAYYKKTGKTEGVDVQPALRLIATTYLKHGPERAFDAIRELEQNKKLIERYQKEGVKIESYERGITREYDLRTDERQKERTQEKIQSELDIIYNRLGQLKLEKESKDKLSGMREKSIAEQLKAVEKILSEHKFSDKDTDLKREIKGHTHTVRSIGSRPIKEVEERVEFYVSQDPFETLHVGQYFGSCLSLAKNHSWVNGWASVVQTMDCNKNVIYAKGSNGNYLSRNRTVLTDSGIVCTRFYQNSTVALEDAWIDYLVQYGKEAEQDILIPTMFASGIMEEKLKKMIKQGKASKEERKVHIDNAYFSAFYSDGLMVLRTPDGRLQMKTEAYVLSYSK